MRDIAQSPSKHYSPLRYPGGKSCLSNFLADAIKANNIQDCTYVEPYGGGAGAALTLLFLEKVDRIVINDLDKSIFAFWKSALDRTTDLIRLIEKTPVTIDEWQNQKNIYKSQGSSDLELGFATFYLNRTNHSGVIDGGPIGGIDQKGTWPINARFNKDSLIKKIESIASYKSRIKVLNLDGINLLTKLRNKANYFIYLDPPYFVKGSCLYLNHYKGKNHDTLAEFLNSHNELFWVLTYDNVQEIKDLYNSRRQFDFNLNYHIREPKLGKEILVLSDRVIIP